MKNFLIVLVIFIGLNAFSQTSFYFSYPRCEITGVLNGELIRHETKNVKAGLDDFSHDFIAVIGFNDFSVKNKITGEDINFNNFGMKIKGQIPLNDMRVNNKQVQNYTAELDVVFPNETITSIFNIEVQYFANGKEGFRVVRMKTEIPIDDTNEKLKDFEKTIFIDISYNIYKFKSY